MEFNISSIDIAILVGYIILSKAIPLWLTRDKANNTKGYFLGGKSFTWPMIGLSLFATNQSGNSFIGLAGGAYQGGISVYSYEWMAAVILVFFAIFILPFYIRSKVFTMPEFLEKRYDYRTRRVFSAFNTFNLALIGGPVAIYSGALVVTTIFPKISIFTGVIILTLLSGVLSFVGGLSAVVISDMLQAIVLVIGAVVVSVYAFNLLPSWEEFLASIPEKHVHIVQPADDPDLPWPGLFSGLIIIGIYAWTSDQVMVQRVLGAKNLNQGRLGALFAGFLKLPILFTLILPGLFALYLFPDLEKADLAYPTLIAEVLPVGIKGVILAALVAAITSSVDSILTSSSTLVTLDFVKPMRKNISEQQLVWVGRLTTAIIMLLLMVWSPLIQNFPSVWNYLQAAFSYTVPPVVMLFLLGITWRKANRHGAFWGLTISLAIGITGFVFVEVLEYVDLHFLYAAVIISVVTLIVHIGISLATAPEPTEKVEPLLWTADLWHEETEALRGIPFYQNYRFWCVILLITTEVIVGWWW